MSRKSSPADVEFATGRLRSRFPIGATVTTLTTHTTAAGNRSVHVLAPSQGPAGESVALGGGVDDVSAAVAMVLGWSFDRTRGGVKVAGVGVEAGAHLVNVLSRKLYGDGYALSHNRL